jgi:hypothetical protein
MQQESLWMEEEELRKVDFWLGKSCWESWVY